MREPNLQEIEDYHELKGEKKKVVWAVVFATLLMGVVYVFAYSYFGPTDAIEVKETIGKMPLR